MPTKKEVVGETPKDLWKMEAVKPVSIKDFVSGVAETEKIIAFGESNTGKTSFYLSILRYLKNKGIKKEDLLMCIIFPDRPTGLAKLYNSIPKEYVECVEVFPINTYEDLVRSTASAENILEEHYKKTKKFGWLVIELLEDAWKSSQDYYCRLAYGETMGEYFAKKRADVKAMKEDTTAYKALEGWGDWPIIKYFHNFNWIDKIKRMQYNVLFTSELKEEGNKDSIFHDLGYRPAGEKDNMHRVDTILYLSHKGNEFFIRPFKLTGYKKLYGQINVTNKNAYEVHKRALKKLEEFGHRTSAIDELEAEAGITPPKKIEKKKEEKPKEEEKKEEKAETKKDDWDISM
jgi:hypothetical protein